MIIKYYSCLGSTVANVHIKVGENNVFGTIDSDELYKFQLDIETISILKTNIKEDNELVDLILRVLNSTKGRKFYTYV
ncbi:MAG: hypothetical protein ACRC6E_05570 [Fusobacteriaceae bacterium]